jgi:protein arginine kinase activator
MKCQKCGNSAAVHLTEVVTGPDGNKRALEIHLCLAHAVEAGIIAPDAGMVAGAGSPSPEEAGTETPTAIVPSKPAPTGLAVTRSEPAAADTCPICGNTWHQFRQSGLVGCSHDYTFFEAKMVPLLKRAQEGATQHAGKVPAKLRHGDPARDVVTLRLRRELQRALDAENYEQAAALRDQLRKLGSN